MEHIQKDDIIIRKGILHILDSHTGYLGSVSYTHLGSLMIRREYI